MKDIPLKSSTAQGAERKLLPSDWNTLYLAVKNAIKRRGALDENSAEQLADTIESAFNRGVKTSTGSANSYEVMMNYKERPLDKEFILFIAHQTNTGATTFKHGNAQPYPIKYNGNNIKAKDIKANTLVGLLWNLANSEYTLIRWDENTEEIEANKTAIAKNTADIATINASGGGGAGAGIDAKTKAQIVANTEAINAHKKVANEIFHHEDGAYDLGQIGTNNSEIINKTYEDSYVDARNLLMFVHEKMAASGKQEIYITGKVNQSSSMFVYALNGAVPNGDKLTTNDTFYMYIRYTDAGLEWDWSTEKDNTRVGQVGVPTKAEGFIWIKNTNTLRKKNSPTGFQFPTKNYIKNGVLRELSNGGFGDFPRKVRTDDMEEHTLIDLGYNRDVWSNTELFVANYLGGGNWRTLRKHHDVMHDTTPIVHTISGRTETIAMKLKQGVTLKGGWYKISLLLRSDNTDNSEMRFIGKKTHGVQMRYYSDDVKQQKKFNNDQTGMFLYDVDMEYQMQGKIRIYNNGSDARVSSTMERYEKDFSTTPQEFYRFSSNVLVANRTANTNVFTDEIKFEIYNQTADRKVGLVAGCFLRFDLDVGQGYH